MATLTTLNQFIKKSVSRSLRWQADPVLISRLFSLAQGLGRNEEVSGCPLRHWPTRRGGVSFAFPCRTPPGARARRVRNARKPRGRRPRALPRDLRVLRGGAALRRLGLCSHPPPSHWRPCCSWGACLSIL